jgi:hypothetical protein
MATTADVRHELASLADPRRAEGVGRFLQMIPGGYGEGDRAIGVSVPEQRRVAGRYWRDLSLAETATLLKSSVHEERLTVMPRVMLRYAIEKFEPQRRREYLSGVV